MGLKKKVGPSQRTNVLQKLMSKGIGKKLKELKDELALKISALGNLKEDHQDSKKSGGEDRAAFNKKFGSLKKLVDESKSEVKQLEPKVRKILQQILNIENSKFFLFCDLISDRIDVFFRFMYPCIFFFYFGYMLSHLYGESYLQFAFLGTGALFLILYVTFKLRQRMKQSKLTLKQAAIFYFKCRCCLKIH